MRALQDALVDAVLGRLDFSGRPEPTLAGLRSIYSAWCGRVPFDNMRKLIHVRRGDLGPLPGDTAVDFFESWLRFGTGGTCWAGNGALCALLGSLGFNATRAVGTMLTAPHLPPNHGSVTVDWEGRRYLVDASILHGEPLLLDAAGASAGNAAWGANCDRHLGHWVVRWRPLHKLDGLDCRIDEFDATAASFHQRHEKSRSWSPFNFELYLRLNRGTAVTGIAFGRRIDLDDNGHATQWPMDGHARVRFLIEEIGINEEIVHALPLDIPTPPPPH